MEERIAFGVTNILMVSKLQVYKIKSDAQGTLLLFIVPLQIETSVSGVYDITNTLVDYHPRLAMELFLDGDPERIVCEYHSLRFFLSEPQTS